MSAVTLALVAAALLCLAFDAKKVVAVAGLALLFYLHPLLCTALLVLGGAAFSLFRYFIQYYKRSAFHVRPRPDPKLPTRRD
jgi:hypothetical protein